MAQRPPPFVDLHLHAEGVSDADLTTLAWFGLRAAVTCANDAGGRDPALGRARGAPGANPLARRRRPPPPVAPLLRRSARGRPGRAGPPPRRRARGGAARAPARAVPGAAQTGHRA